MPSIGIMTFTSNWRPFTKTPAGNAMRCESSRKGGEFFRRIRRSTVYTARFKAPADMPYKLLSIPLLLCVSLPLCFPQTLKVEVNLVNIFATVKDDQGRFVENLTKDDFRVYDDDQPQNLEVFDKQDKVESSIGMLMDTSGSMVDILPYMRRGVRDFTRSLSKSDDFF